jgi:hypothetical protein
MKFQRAFNVRSLVILSVMLFCGATPSSGQSKSPWSPQVMTINFAGIDYLHRWSKDGQNEFTPLNQSNLSTWHDMVTINLHENVTNENQLAELANRVLSQYRGYEFGEVLRTDSKPRTADSPAEHLIVALLADPTLMEAVFARIILKDGAGVIAVYSHRVYGSGEKRGAAIGHWLDRNATQVEKALMAWGTIPRVALLKQLPQSE